MDGVGMGWTFLEITSESSTAEGITSSDKPSTPRCLGESSKVVSLRVLLRSEGGVKQSPTPTTVRTASPFPFVCKSACQVSTPIKEHTTLIKGEVARSGSVARVMQCHGCGHTPALSTCLQWCLHNNTPRPHE